MDLIFIVLLAALIVWSLWDGKVVAFGGLTDRKREPKLFWAMISFEFVFLAALVSIYFRP